MTEEDDMTTPGARFRQWREENDLSLRDVSDLTGWSESMISMAERGKRTFSTEAKVQISRALGVRIADLFGTPNQSAQVPA